MNTPNLLHLAEQTLRDLDDTTRYPMSLRLRLQLIELITNLTEKLSKIKEDLDEN